MIEKDESIKSIYQKDCLQPMKFKPESFDSNTFEGEKPKPSYQFRNLEI